MGVEFPVEGDMGSTLMHLGISACLIVVVLVVCKVRKWPVKETLALRLPTIRSLTFWILVFVVFAAVEELFANWMGMGGVNQWDYPILVSVVRAFGIVILAPLGEEMVFRGLLFKRISETRLGIYGAILIPALIFAGVHIQYSIAAIAFIFVDGVFFGLARNYSKSLWVPVILHSLGNLYAVVQRIWG